MKLFAFFVDVHSHVLTVHDIGSEYIKKLSTIMFPIAEGLNLDT